MGKKLSYPIFFSAICLESSPCLVFKRPVAPSANYYNYGVGSAGFGVFRELITHIKTTNWVLEGAIATFPLMYHYRIVPFTGQRADLDLSDRQKYVEYWNNSTNIGNYMSDRANANYELILFLEYIPYVLETWLSSNLDKFQKPLDDLRETIDFLRANGIIHFDAHFHNILTDGEQAYLTDFGLILDRNFALTKDEESVFDRHIFYDYGEILWNLARLVRYSYTLCTEEDRGKIAEKYALEAGLKPYEFTAILINNIEEIHADGKMKLDDAYVATIVKYRQIVILMGEFFGHLRENDRKDTIFPELKLRSLLKETGFISSEDMGRSVDN